MKFGIAGVGTPEITKEMWESVHNLSDKLELFFYDRDYGTSVSQLYIRFVCLNPKYGDIPTEERKSKVKNNRKERLIEFNLYMDFDKIITSNDKEIRKLIIQEFIYRLFMLRNLTFKDFKIDILKQDLETFYFNEFGEKYLEREVLK
jgi:hypothetical protein